MITFLKKIYHYFFGQVPPIFDENGRVYRPVSKQDMEAWEDRYRSSPEHDWRHHKAKQ